jgi:hypothetical protein
MKRFLTARKLEVIKNLIWKPLKYIAVYIVLILNRLYLILRMLKSFWKVQGGKKNNQQALPEKNKTLKLASLTMI